MPVQLKDRPKRVLHVVRAMNRGGVETWLMHLLRRIDPRRVALDFLVQTPEPAAYDDEIIERGGRILRCCEPVSSPAYFMHLERILRSAEAYDAVHSHVHHFSGWVLGAARRCGVPTRIAHSHLDSCTADRSASLPRRCYLAASKRAIRVFATRLVGVSRVAARALFGESWQDDHRSVLLHCGIDFSPFRRLPEPRAVRQQWNVGEDELLIGHVGRFDPQKNHAFLLEIFAEIVRRRSRSRLLLAGDGALRPRMERRARELGVAGKTIFAGVRDDIPSLLGALDAFVFPSMWEGLPLAVVEAQAAGAPCIISAAISEETDVIRRLIHRVELTRTPGEWAEIVIRAARHRSPGPQSLAALEQSGFDISHSTEQVYGLYSA